MLFDVAHRVMKFMWDNKLKPSDALIEEYRHSKTIKTLDMLTSKELEERWYDNLKKEYRRKIIKNKI